MANAPLTAPRLHVSPGTSSPALTRPGVTDGSNSWTAGQTFVNNTSNALVAYVADDTAIYGLSPDKSHAVTDEPYTAPYGEIHNVIDPRGQQFVMNITDGSGTVGSGSTTQGNVAVGTLYSARYLASPYTAFLALDASDTGGGAIFRVDALWPQDATTDFNGRVIVSILGTAIQ